MFATALMWRRQFDNAALPFHSHAKAFQEYPNDVELSNRHYFSPIHFLVHHEQFASLFQLLIVQKYHQWSLNATKIRELYRLFHQTSTDLVK
ncbi:hypothetical protein D3494_15130 [Listeria monocytogenes]|nr:hypothetical protein [Listeria monocytogenes]EAD2804404.1 hypothetical protein [Listeria monocytogenes]